MDYKKKYKEALKRAKDGNVLAFGDNIIVIFKDLYNASSFHSYCHIEDGVLNISQDDTPDWWNANGFYPAAEEQRDTLIKAMEKQLDTLMKLLILIKKAE